MKKSIAAGHFEQAENTLAEMEGQTLVVPILQAMATHAQAHAALAAAEEQRTANLIAMSGRLDDPGTVRDVRAAILARLGLEASGELAVGESIDVPGGFAAWEKVAAHPVFASCYGDGVLIDAVVRRLDALAKQAEVIERAMSLASDLRALLTHEHVSSSVDSRVSEIVDALGSQRTEARR